MTATDDWGYMMKRINHEKFSANRQRYPKLPASLLTRTVTAFAAAGLLATHAVAQNPAGDFLNFYNDESTGNSIKGDMGFYSAHFAQSNSWAGNSEELLGADSDFWGEYGVTAGIEGVYHLANGSRFSSRVSGVFSSTNHGLDAGGSNISGAGDDDTDRSALTFEEVYVRWSSGDLYSDLGKDAIELTAGSQVYKQGTGFLFYDAGADGGKRGGFWLGLRKAFQYTATAKLTTGNWMVEGYYLEPDLIGEETKMAGINIEYDFGPRADVGFSYTNVFDSDDDRRDGLDVLDFRASVQPFESWDGLRLVGEVAVQDNGDENDSIGGYLQAIYTFDESMRWSPRLSYRAAHFSGDDGEGDNEAFDPLTYGFNDWNEWFIGEIIGEYVSSNRNLTSHTLNLHLSPRDDFSLGLYYIYFRLDEKSDVIVPRPPTSARAALITDRDLAHEVNVTVDWSLTEQIYVGMMAGLVIPEDGAEDFFGDDENWGVFMLNLSYSF